MIRRTDQGSMASEADEAMDWMPRRRDAAEKRLSNREKKLELPAECLRLGRSSAKFTEERGSCHCSLTAVGSSEANMNEPLPSWDGCKACDLAPSVEGATHRSGYRSGTSSCAVRRQPRCRVEGRVCTHSAQEDRTCPLRCLFAQPAPMQHTDLSAEGGFTSDI